MSLKSEARDIARKLLDNEEDVPYTEPPPEFKEHPLRSSYNTGHYDAANGAPNWPRKHKYYGDHEKAYNKGYDATWHAMRGLKPRLEAENDPQAVGNTGHVDQKPVPDPNAEPDPTNARFTGAFNNPITTNKDTPAGATTTQDDVDQGV